MTEGNISRHLRKFLAPLLLGNVFQQLYNVADSIIVGKYVGKEAFAAVGCANPIMSIALFLIVGVTVGASILMSELFGKGDMISLKKEVATSIVSGAIFTVILMALFIPIISPLLNLIKTPEDIFSSCKEYLIIIYSGLMFAFIYNVFAQSLRAIGDSKIPLIFLMISVVINIILDFVFIKHIGLGVKGAAIATIVSQVVCAIGIVTYVYIAVPELKLKLKEIKIDFSLLGKTVSYSWITALQQTVLYVGKFFVQGAINPLGVDSIAAFNAVTRIDAFGMAPSDSLNASVTTFTAQNRGAGKTERLGKGFTTALTMGIVFNSLVSVAVYFSAKPLVEVFLEKGELEAIKIGVEYLKSMSIFYILMALCNVFQGFFRGLGDLKITLIATTINLSSRIVFAYILCPKIGLSGVAYSCVGGWIVMLIMEYLVYRQLKKNNYQFRKSKQKA